jgi:hypothetical protein
MSKLIDSPFEICSVCDQYVFLDQTYEQCVQEHQCQNVKCPLKKYFVGRQPPKTDTGNSETDGAKE